MVKRLPWEITAEMFLNEAEADRLLAHLRRQADASAGRERLVARLDELIVQCLMFSGLRNSEFCRLTLADTCLGHGQSMLAVEDKADGTRNVYLPPRVNDLLRKYVAEVRPAFVPEDVDADDLSQPLVFNEHRQPYERTALYRRVVRILTAAGLAQRASVQLLRHTYGYLAYKRTGGNLLFVQRQLGHAHPMVTVVYARFVKESYGELAGRLDLAPAKRAHKPIKNKRKEYSNGR